jgi:hypothetical protein
MRKNKRKTKQIEAKKKKEHEPINTRVQPI